MEGRIELSVGEFHFIDWNYPEVIYLGSQADFDSIADGGGHPRRWLGEVAPVGEAVSVKSNDGTLRLEVMRISGR